MIETESQVIVKPTILLSTNNTGDSWRKAEVVTAIVESCLRQLVSAKTISSTKTRDIAGDLEDLDVAFSYYDDFKGYFAFAEVRDRGKKVGRNYIQEIMAKRDTTRIKDATIVSTHGFTKNAKKLAALSSVNIPLKLLVKDDISDIWLGSNEVPFHEDAWRLKKAIVRTVVDGEIRNLEIKSEEFSDRLFLIPSQNPELFMGRSLPVVFENELLKRPDVQKRIYDVAPDGRFYDIKPEEVFFEPVKYYLDRNSLTDGLIPVTVVAFFLETSRKITTGPVVARYKYLDAQTDEVLARLVIIDFLVDKMIVNMCVVQSGYSKNTCNVNVVIY